MRNFIWKIKYRIWYALKVHKRLNLKIIGSKNKKAEELVFLHGIASNIRVWDKVIAELKDDYRIILIDLLGFGKSPKPENIEYDLEQHTYAVYRALKKAKIKRKVTVIGHSMGSIIASHLAQKFPNKTKRLVLCSMPIYKRSELTDNKLFIWQRETDNLYFRLYRILRHKKDFSIKTAQMLRKMGFKQVELNQQSWPAFKNSLRNIIERQSVEQDFKKIKVPIDIIAGKLDLLVINKNLEHLKKFSNVRMVIVGARHDINKSYGRDIARLIDCP